MSSPLSPQFSRFPQKIRACLENRPAVQTDHLALDLLHVRRAADVANIDGHQSKSSARSKAGAECVKAPTEIQFTPVSAIDLTLSSVTPPDASVTARPSTSATAERRSASSMLSSMITS